MPALPFNGDAVYVVIWVALLFALIPFAIHWKVQSPFINSIMAECMQTGYLFAIVGFLFTLHGTTEVKKNLRVKQFGFYVYCGSKILLNSGKRTFYPRQHSELPGIKLNHCRGEFVFLL